MDYAGFKLEVWMLQTDEEGSLRTKKMYPSPYESPLQSPFAE